MRRKEINKDCKVVFGDEPEVCICYNISHCIDHCKYCTDNPPKPEYATINDITEG